MAKTFGIQAQTDGAAIDEIMLGHAWRDFCASLAEAMELLAKADPQPDEHSLASGPNRGEPPPYDYREHYHGFAENKGTYFQAVLVNDKRNAIWIETGTHPGGNSTYVPGHHVMARAMEGAFNIVRGL